MIMESFAEPTWERTQGRYVQDAGSVMMGSKSVPIVTETTNAKRLLRDIEMIRANGDDGVRLAPSKLLRTPPFLKANLPLPIPGMFLNFDIPWDVIEEDSISEHFLEAFRYVYIQIYCNHCERVYLVPYILPKWVKSLEGLRPIPVHYCPIAPYIKYAVKIVPFSRMKFPILGTVDIYGSTVRTEEYPREIRYLGSESENDDLVYRNYVYPTPIERLPMSYPLQMKSIYKDTNLRPIEVKYVCHATEGTKTIITTIIDTEDVVALNYLVSDILVGLDEHNKVIIPAHLDWIKCFDIDMVGPGYERLH
jgi:hypothetical protein